MSASRRAATEAHREQQHRFIERRGLIDTGFVHQVAPSGTTVWRSATMTQMLAEARTGAFDPLLAGYSTAGSATSGGHSSSSKTACTLPASLSSLR